jgi:hypothetical protein
VSVHVGQTYRERRPSTQWEHQTKFSEVVEQASALLQRKGRITYRALKREFTLEDDALADLKFELITGQELAVDKDGDVLVWVGDAKATPKLTSLSAHSPPPVSYTPPHLADRIRACIPSRNGEQIPQLAGHHGHGTGCLKGRER